MPSTAARHAGEARFECELRVGDSALQCLHQGRCLSVLRLVTWSPLRTRWPATGPGRLPCAVTASGEMRLPLPGLEAQLLQPRYIGSRCCLFVTAARSSYDRPPPASPPRPTGPGSSLQLCCRGTRAGEEETCSSASPSAPPHTGVRLSVGSSPQACLCRRPAPLCNLIAQRPLVQARHWPGLLAAAVRRLTRLHATRSSCYCIDSHWTKQVSTRPRGLAVE